MKKNIFEGKSCLVFDFDGVICDSVNVKTQAFLDLYKGYDVSILDQIRHFHLQNGGISRYEKIKYFEEKILNRNLTNEQHMILVSKFSEIVFSKVIDSNFILGSLEFLKRSKGRFKIFLCTATPQFEIEKILKFKKINKYFDAVYGSPDDKYVLFNKILYNQSINVNEMIYFGDSFSDYEVANYFNVDFIGITNDFAVFPKEVIKFQNFHNSQFYLK